MTVVDTSQAEVRLSPANSFSPRTAFLTVGPVRLDLSDPEVCEHLAEQLDRAADSLRRAHRTIDMGRLD